MDIALLSLHSNVCYLDLKKNDFRSHLNAQFFPLGSHGAGDPSETETPIVAWGAGVALPKDPSEFKEKMMYDARIERWGLTHVRRHDMHQADVAPLMASIVGIPIPVNSVVSWSPVLQSRFTL